MADWPATTEDLTLDDELEEIYQLRKDAAKHQATWRREAKESFEFRDGDQWDSTDRALLEEQRRPVVTFNRCKPIISSVVGHEIGNRQELRFKPRTMDDAQTNEVYTEAARWVLDRCDAEDEESDAYEDAITCGMGWTEIRVDYEEEPDGKIIKERLSPLEMRWDPGARKANLADAKWLMREQWLDISEARERWPEHRDAIEPMADVLADDEWIEEHDATHAWQYSQDQAFWDPKSNKVLVITYQHREREPYWRIGDTESGKVVELTPERYERLRDRIERLGAPAVRQHRWVYKQKIIIGQTIVEEGDAPGDGVFSFHVITGARDEAHGTWYGLMRAMHDPQVWANKFFSQSMHIFNSNAKGGLLVEEGAVNDKREFEENWASPEGVNYVNDGAIAGGQIMQKDLGGYPTALDKLMAFAISSIRDVSGVNLELLGMANREQAGVLEVERKKAALVVLAPLTNSLRRYRKISGRALLAFIHRYVPEGTIMRATNRDPSVFYRDEDVTKYDVIVDTAPSSPNLKEEVWSVLGNIVPAMVRAGVPLPPDLIRFSPLPESVASEWVEYIEQRSAIPEDATEQIQKLQEELQKLTDENRQLSDKREQAAAQLNQKREEAMLEAQIREQEILSEARAREMELAWKVKMSDADRAAKLMEIDAKYRLEMEKCREQGAMDRENVLAKLEADKESQVVSLDAEREKRKTEREEKFEQAMSPKLEQWSKQTGQAVEKVSEDFESFRQESEERRKLILDFLKSRGGEVAQFASKLDS